MKLSTRIKKYAGYWVHGSGEFTSKPIILMVDGKRKYKGEELRTTNLYILDEYHRYLTKDEHCTLLPLNECPVVNDKEIIMHYTSTTYKEWCNP